MNEFSYREAGEHFREEKQWNLIKDEKNISVFQLPKWITIEFRNIIHPGFYKINIYIKSVLQWMFSK